MGNRATAATVDAKQRAIFSATPLAIQADPNKTAEMRTIICAEPSPDALSAYASSGALTAAFKSASSADTAAQGQAAIAAGETAASIGLRTQSIQLLRDGLSADCLFYLNVGDALNYHQLLRRSQDFTLGLLAIEQLTGAVKADQAALGTTSSAATGSENVDKQTAAVDAAMKSQNDAKTQAATSQKSLKDAKGKLADSQQKRDAALKDQADPNNAVDPAKTSAKNAVDAANAAVVAAQKDVDAAQIAADADTRTAANADAQLATARENLSDAQRQVRAATTASAQLASAAGASRAAVTDRVASAVVKIVETVFAEAGRGETCELLAAVAASNPDSARNNAAFRDLVAANCSTAQKYELATKIGANPEESAKLFLRFAAPVVK